MLNKIQEIFLALVLIILSVLLWNPTHIGMGSNVEMMIVVGLVLVFAVFAIFIWREQARDEREQSNFAFAGRVAFLSGTAVLVLGILVQTFQHRLDLWLVLTLGFMILAKIFANVYSYYKH